MERYKNLDNKSGISSFEIGTDFIIIEFRSGGTYVFSYASAGKSNIEQMKRLALEGKGLATFINQHVKNKYAKKLK